MAQLNRGIAITPSDTVNIFMDGALLNALYVGGAGNAVLVTQDDRTVTLSGLTAGSAIPFRFKRVNATNTTATLLVGLFAN